MKVILRDQVVDDVLTMMDITDEVLDKKHWTTAPNEGYFRLLRIVEIHLHYCLDNYKFIDDEVKAMTPT